MTGVFVVLTLIFFGIIISTAWVAYSRGFDAPVQAEDSWHNDIY